MPRQWVSSRDVSGAEEAEEELRCWVDFAQGELALRVPEACIRLSWTGPDWFGPESTAGRSVPLQAPAPNELAAAEPAREESPGESAFRQPRSEAEMRRSACARSAEEAAEARPRSSPETRSEQQCPTRGFGH